MALTFNQTCIRNHLPLSYILAQDDSQHVASLGFEKSGTAEIRTANPWRRSEQFDE